MTTIKYYLNKLLTIVSGLLFFIGIASFWGIFTTTTQMNILAYILEIIFSVLLILLGGVGLFLPYSLLKRCHQCKSWFSIQKRGTKLEQSKSIYVVVENKTRSAYSGKVTEIQEQHIPGKRNTYKTTYKCKHCGAEKYKYKDIDTPNV